MSLPAGVRIGPYEIDAAIGAGGVGEVYRTHDTKLGRDVALKILPPQFASDADRLMRFEREAKPSPHSTIHTSRRFTVSRTAATHVRS